MNEKGLLKRMMVSVGVAMTNAEKLMEIESEDMNVFALNAFLKLVETEMVLMNALGVKTAEAEKNPLARRSRLEQ